MKVLVLLEHFDDGQGEPTVFADTPGGRKKMEAKFRSRVRENIGSRDYEGRERELTEEEILKIIQDGVDNDFDWTGWDCKVQTFECDIEE